MSYFIPTTWLIWLLSYFRPPKLEEGFSCEVAMALESTLLLFILIFSSSLLSPSDGLAAFRAFLRTEFSEENLEFWLACEEYKKIKSQSKMASKAKKIFAEYIAIQSCKEVSESGVKNSLVQKIKHARSSSAVLPHVSLSESFLPAGKPGFIHQRPH